MKPCPSRRLKRKAEEGCISRRKNHTFRARNAHLSAGRLCFSCKSVRGTAGQPPTKRGIEGEALWDYSAIIRSPAPICGNATPRLLPTKVEGVPICKECDKKIDLPNGVLDSMTLDDFRRYIDFTTKIRVLRERFHPEYRFGFGAFNTQLVL